MLSRFWFITCSLQSYSCFLKSSARAYAHNCVFQHSHGPYGENVYLASGAPSTNPLPDAGSDWRSKINETWRFDNDHLWYIRFSS